MKKVLFILFSIFGHMAYAQDPLETAKNQVEKHNQSIIDAENAKKTLKTGLEDLKKQSEENINIYYIDTTQTIIYDFKTKRYTKSNVRPKVSEPLVFIIKNINRLAYDVHIESADIAIADEFFNNEIKGVATDNTGSATGELKPTGAIPALTTDVIKLSDGKGGIKNVDIKKISDKVDNIQLLKEKIIKLTQLRENVNSADASTVINIFKTDLKSLYEVDINNSATTVFDDLGKIIDDLGVFKKFENIDKSNQSTKDELINKFKTDDAKSFKGKLNDNTNNIDNILKDAVNNLTEKSNLKLEDGKTEIIKGINKKISLIIDEVAKAEKAVAEEEKIFVKLNEHFTSLTQLYSEVVKNANRMVELEQEYKDYRAFALNPVLEKDEYLEKYIGKKEKGPLSDFVVLNGSKQKEISKFASSITEFYNKYNLIHNDWDLSFKLAPESAENIRLKYDLIKAEVDKINSTVNSEALALKFTKVLAMDKILRKDKCYQMGSSPIQPLEDYVTFDITIKSRDIANIAEYNDNREFKYMEYTHGGVRFDFSTGVVFDMESDNEKYGLRDASVTTGEVTENGKQIVVTDRNRFTPNVAGMFHASLRSTHMVSFGLTLGASLDADTFQLNSLFPGLSVLWGKKQKFIFTAGPAFKLQNALKDNYKEKQIYPAEEFGDNAEITSDQFRIGWFVGITYNLTSKQRGKFKIE